MKSLPDKRRLLYLFLIPVIAGLIFYGLNLGNNFFTVRKITVTSDRGDDKIYGLNDLYYKNLIFLNTQEEERNLTVNNPQIKKAGLKKIFPDKIELSVSYYNGLVNFTADRGYFVLAETGQILYKTSEMREGLPTVSYYQRYSFDQYGAGDKLTNRDILTALHFLTSLENLGLRIVSIDINGLNMIGFNLNNKKIVFTTEKDNQIQDYQLKTIIKQFKLEGKDFKTLDLRFDKPVVELM